MDFDAILFDLDGTLVETIDLYEEACRQAFALAGIDLTKDVFAELYVKGWLLPEWLRHFSIDATQENFLRDARDNH